MNKFYWVEKSERPVTDSDGWAKDSNGNTIYQDVWTARWKAYPDRYTTRTEDTDYRNYDTEEEALYVAAVRWEMALREYAGLPDYAPKPVRVASKSSSSGFGWGVAAGLLLGSPG